MYLYNIDFRNVILTVMNKKYLIFFSVVIIEVLSIIYISNTYSKIKFTALFVDLPTSNFINYSVNTSYRFFYPSERLKFFYINPPNSYRLLNESNEVTVYSMNSEGLRGANSYSKEKPKSVFRIAFFGDSFVYGLYNNQTDIFTELLQKKYDSLNCSKKIEVMNFGVPAYDFSDMVELFRQKGKYYEPDVTFFLLDFAILDWNNEVFLPIVLSNLQKEGWPTRNSVKQRENYTRAMSAAYKEYDALFDSPDFLASLENRFKKNLQDLNFENNEKSKIVITALLLNSRVNASLIYDGNKYNFLVHSLNYSDSFHRLWTSEFSVKQDVDEHPNRLGHEFLAESFYSYLLSNGLINC